MRLVLTLLFVFSLNLRAQEIAAGRWEGSANIPDRELKLIVDLARDNAGAWIGSITIPSLNLKGAALGDIALNGSNLSFALKSPLLGQPAGAISFKAHADGNKLNGELSQGGNSAPLSLKKTGPPQVELPPRNTPIAKGLEGEWKGDYELLGYTRHTTIKLNNREKDGASAEFVVVGRKINNLPVSLITQEGDFITVNSGETGVSYEGRFKKDGGEINGTIIQGSIEVPLVLRRAK